MLHLRQKHKKPLGTTVRELSPVSRVAIKKELRELLDYRKKAPEILKEIRTSERGIFISMKVNDRFLFDIIHDLGGLAAAW